MVSDILVIGGGASGLVAAIVAARKGKQVTIIEHKDKLGKKILATGNGKCNYTNMHQEPSCYRGEDALYAQQVLEEFGVEDTIFFFKELGIYPKERNGYLYPNSEQASSVLDVLRLELENLNVKIVCSEHVERIDVIYNKDNSNSKNLTNLQNRNPKCFQVHTNVTAYQAYHVILATGGMASSDLGSDGSGYKLAKSFGHHIITPVPALVQLKAYEKFFKSLAGIRVQSKINLYIQNNLIANSIGELQLTNYGVSGIPIFEISRYASRALQEMKQVDLSIDFLPDIETNEVTSLIEGRIKTCSYKSVESIFIGLLNKKLSYVIIKEAGISPDKPSSALTKLEINLLMKQIKNFRVSIESPNPFASAQVSAGGVKTNEIDSKTMESKLIKGLYLTGELLDIDGTCGGYNLQWAWSTGYLAGQASAISLGLLKGTE